MNKTKDGSIIIKCNSDKDSEKISKSIDENDPMCIKKQEKIKSRIRIVNLSVYAGKDVTTNDIIMRNDLPSESINILHTFKQKNELNSIIAEVTCEAYSTIMSTGALFVDRERCKVYNEFDLNNENVASKILLTWFCRSRKIIGHVFFLFLI